MIGATIGNVIGQQLRTEADTRALTDKFRTLNGAVSASIPCPSTTSAV